MVLKRKIISLFLLLLAFNLLGQDIPERPSPPRLVNDFANLLSVEQSNALEQKLIAFSDSTSTQIAVVIVTSLNGMDKADFTVRLAEKWGVGQKGKNNGLVIMIKPKYASERGEVFIATGYGVEGAVPDALAKRIVEKEMIPEFKNNNYFSGIDKAVNTIIALTKGEFTADEYNKKSDGDSPIGVILFLIIFFVLFVAKFGNKNNNKQTLGRRSSSPFFIPGPTRSSGGFGGFSSGSGSFGGFGGGSFGGGGSGGSW